MLSVWSAISAPHWVGQPIPAQPKVPKANPFLVVERVEKRLTGHARPHRQRTPTLDAPRQRGTRRALSRIQHRQRVEIAIEGVVALVVIARADGRERVS